MSQNKTDPKYSKEDRKTVKFPLQPACSGSETHLSQTEKKPCLYCSGAAFRRDHDVISIRPQFF